jgi:hypothetical protein
MTSSTLGCMFFGWSGKGVYSDVLVNRCLERAQH